MPKESKKDNKGVTKSPPKEPKEIKEKQVKEIKEVKETKESKEGKEFKTMSKLPRVTQSDKTLHIPRNVNSYSHFLHHPYITEKDIEWVLKLRNTDSDTQEMQERLARIPNQPFNVADRKTVFSEIKHTVTDVNLKGNSTNFLHLLRHRLGATANAGQVQFETGLRSYGGSEKDLKEKERKWTNIPKHDQKEFPQFMPKYQEEATLRKQMSDTGKIVKMTYTGFDGDSAYPGYTMKYKQKNLQDVRHLFAPGVKMSCVLWEEGLRELKPIKKVIENTDKKDLTKLKK